MLTEEEVISRVKSRFQAKTKVGHGLRPDKVSVEEYGNHASYVDDGYRYWGFVSERGRDKFVLACSTAEKL